ncbi:MAG: hypothetical protein ABIC82_04350 [bacterium]
MCISKHTSNKQTKIFMKGYFDGRKDADATFCNHPRRHAKKRKEDMKVLKNNLKK